MSSIH